MLTICPGWRKTCRLCPDRRAHANSPDFPLERTLAVAQCLASHGHKRYFDRDSFIDLFRQCNLRITKETGLMLKPFSTAQLNALDLPDSVWEVLFHSGDLAPAYAYGLYVEVRLPERLHG